MYKPTIQFSFSFSLLIILISNNVSSNKIMSKSWITSCKPCIDILNSCTSCINEQCIQCVLEVPNTGCYNCLSDIMNINDKFYCDNSFTYHSAVCSMYCRMNSGSSSYRDGYCDENTSLCTCTTTPMPTTPHPILTYKCEFKVKFESGSNILVVNENVSQALVKVKLEPNYPTCVFASTVTVKVATKEYTALNGRDFLSFSGDIKFTPQSMSYNILIDINDDKLIEPFEFFSVDILSVNPPEYASSVLKKIVYIEDNDYNTPTGVSTDIKQIFEYDTSMNYLYIKYKDVFNQYINIPNPYSIFPKRGGISSPYNKLQVLMQIWGPFTYKIHTIEINNPEKCNLNLMKLRRLDYYERPFEEYISSLLLNQRPVIDVNYFKYFHGLGNAGDEPDILDIFLLSTKDGRNPTSCELRAFAEEVY